MAKFLELPDWEGTEVTEGEEIPAGQERPHRTTPFLAAGKELPPKDGLMRIAEKPCQKVIEAHQKKEQEALKRKAKAGEGTSTSMPKRTRRDPTAPEDVAFLDVTVDATPLNHAHPSVTPVQGQANPGVEENVAGHTAPQMSGEDHIGQGAGENLAGGVNENEASQPMRDNTPPIHLDSPEREQQPRAPDG